jgi:hypothetical protein
MEVPGLAFGTLPPFFAIVCAHSSGLGIAGSSGGWQQLLSPLPAAISSNFFFAAAELLL